jgi:hypothetical protein
MYDYQSDYNNMYGGQSNGYGAKEGFKFTEKTIRNNFVRKVYSILSAQLVVTTLFIALFTFNEGIKYWTFKNPGLLNIALFAPVGLMLVLSFSESARRTSPLNIILLGIFTICKGFALGVVSTIYDVDEVLIAVTLTACIVISLTLFSFQTKYDMTMQSGMLVSTMAAMLVFSIGGIFYRGEFFHFLIACGGAVVFSMYIVYDTQLMMGGDHKFSISPEEYIFAALNIYMDIINLFLYLLKILRYLNESQQQQQRNERRKRN